MPLHGSLVECVDLCRLAGSAGCADVLGDRFDRCAEAPGEKSLRPLAGEGACHSTADAASSSVDHCNLVLQHHLWFPSVPVVLRGTAAFTTRPTCGSWV